MKKIYFGHPVPVYNTPKETELISIIEKEFPDYIIENPNQPRHAKNYQKYKIEKGNGMLYYYQEVLPKMDAGIFLPFEDGMWGAGVFNEAQFLQNQKKSIYEIDYNGIIYSAILDASKKLSIQETRARLYPQ